MTVFYRSYTIRHARPSGGKAGKGRNKTSTIQVYGPADPSLLLRHFRYRVGDEESERLAVTKAKQFINALILKAENDRLLANVLKSDLR